ncbi:MAG: LysR family transcriptional regulator [Coriobacteriales bacterium]|jgi:DNA-binding transcriptional LysR family regulator
MNAEQLRYFELAYRERNYSAAARKVPCSPQGLSKAIHALEKELGVTLFTGDPETGMPVPTDYAHELYEYACVNDSNLRLLHESFERIRGQERYTIRLGCSLGVLGTLGPDFVTSFRRLHPNIALQYWETDDDLCERGLRDSTFDLGLLVGPYGDDLAAQVLYRAPVYFWMRADDPLASKGALTVEDFAGREVALPGEGFKCYRRLLEATEAAGVVPGAIYEMSEIFQLYEFAASGRGLGFSVRHIVELSSFHSSPDVVALPVEGSSWTFGIVRLATHATDQAEQTLWNWCASWARRLPSDPVG